METTFKSPFRAPSTPAGALAAAAVAALLAGILVFSALKAADKEEGVATSASTRVAVAERLIPKGSPAEAVASGNATKLTEVDSAALVGGAVTDVSQIRGQIAAHDILPGQQIATGDFIAADDKALVSKLARDTRAISIPLDASHGMIGDAKRGDRVDVFASFGGSNGQINMEDGKIVNFGAILKPLATNILVLDAPSKAPASGGRTGGSNNDEVVTLRMASRLSAKVAFAADYGKVWMVLRPPAGAPRVNSRPVTLQDVLAGGGFYVVAKKGAAAKKPSAATAGGKSK